jgi:hypothetical protein
VLSAFPGIGGNLRRETTNLFLIERRLAEKFEGLRATRFLLEVALFPGQ